MKLIADNLTIARAGRTIIAGLSLTVGSGEILLLTGANGAGKTTLLRMLAGNIRSESGQLQLTGGDADSTPGEQAHYVGHQNAVKPALTVAENLAFWAQYLRDGTAVGDSGATVEVALARFALADLADVPAAYLSAGQRRRLALARLLTTHRPLWLLDEPTVSLDRRAVDAFAVVVREHASAGGLVIAATHVPLGIDGARELRLAVPAEAA